VTVVWSDVLKVVPTVALCDDPAEAVTFAALAAALVRLKAAVAETPVADAVTL
jgi:hypothetical protein